MRRLITSLDLGSSNIRACLCQLDLHGKLKLLALDNASSNGISGGSIANFEAARNDIAKILKKLEHKSKKKIKSVCVSLSSPTIKGFQTFGMVGLSGKPRQIRERDIEQCKKIACLTQIPIDRQTIQKEIHSFYINEGEKTDNPLGLYATKLSIKLYVVTIETAKAMNLQNLIEQSGYMLEEVVFSGCAIACAVLAKDDRKEAAALIDIGSDLTNIAILEGNFLKYANTIPSGTMHLKDDTTINAYFRNIKDLFRNNPFSRLVVTGGGSLKDGILESAEKHLGIKSEIGQVRLKWCFLSPKESLLHTSSLGLIAYKAERLLQRRRALHPIKRTARFLNDIFESYF